MYQGLGSLGVRLHRNRHGHSARQPGPKPRMFRLPLAQALINRLGFNNKGVDYLIEQVRRSGFKGRVGHQHRQERRYPAERAIDDYLIGLRKVYPWASYVTVNISSPNAGSARPAIRRGAGAIIGDTASGTTTLVRHSWSLRTTGDQDRAGPGRRRFAHGGTGAAPAWHGCGHRHQHHLLASRRGRHVSRLETGGLSGTPLRERSTAVVRRLADILASEIPIIAVGGI